MARELGTAVGASASPTLSQYINLSNYAYTSGLTPPNPKLMSKLGLTPLVANGQTVSSLDSLSGFYGEAFVTSGPSPDVIIAFQGTNPSPPNIVFGAAQAADDAKIYLGQTAYSYPDALSFTQQALAEAASQGIGSRNVFLTGHSLGAAEAEYVASQTGLVGATFGTPGIVAAGAPASRLTNYVERGDPVGNYASDAPDYLGDIVHTGAIRHYGAATMVGPVGHSLNLRYARADYDHYNFVGAAGRLASNAYRFHPLATYARELHFKLYSEDFSAGSDASFFDPLKGGSSLLSFAAAVICYAQGTRIRTARGDVEIERLAVGDEVATAAGVLAPIRWLGHRRIDCRRHPTPHRVQPIRIAAHAFGPSRPARDLVVSPAHSIAVDVMGEALIPAFALVNGTSVTRCDVEQVTYWHLELAAHDIILAENLPAETYLDGGNRGFFGDGGVVAINAVPDAAAIHARFCRPYHEDGPLVDAARARLAARAALGLPRGERTGPMRSGGRALQGS